MPPKKSTYPAVIAGRMLGDSAAMLSMGMSRPKVEAARFVKQPSHNKPPRPKKSKRK